MSRPFVLNSEAIEAIVRDLQRVLDERDKLRAENAELRAALDNARGIATRAWARRQSALNDAAELRAALKAYIDKLQALPEGVFGYAPEAQDSPGWPLRDEVIDGLCKVLAATEEREQGGSAE